MGNQTGRPGPGPAEACGPTAGRQLLRIGKLAAESGASVRTIRYYEERGLLTPAARAPGSYRLYDQRALNALKTIRRLRKLGLGLHEIIALQQVYLREGRCGASVRQEYMAMLQARVQEIDRHIEEMILLRQELSRHCAELQLPAGCGAEGGRPCATGTRDAGERREGAKGRDPDGL